MAPGEGRAGERRVGGGGGSPRCSPERRPRPPPSGQCGAGEGAGVPALPRRGAGGQRGARGGAGPAPPARLRGVCGEGCGLRGARAGGAGPGCSPPRRREGPGLGGPRFNFRGGRAVVTGGVGVAWGSSPEIVRESPWAGGAAVPVLVRVPAAGEGGSRLLREREPRHPRPIRSCPREELPAVWRGLGRGQSPTARGERVSLSGGVKMAFPVRWR